MHWPFPRPHRSPLLQRLARRPYLLLGLLSCGLVLILHTVLPLPLWAAPPDLLHQAQLLNIQGQQAFNEGHPQAALEAWQQAEAKYRQAKDEQGLWGSQLNQSKALQTLGFTRRAQTLLDQLGDTLNTEPPSLLKVNVKLTQGQGLRLLGDLPLSQTYLEQGLAMAQQLADVPHQQLAHLYLGNTLAAQAQWSTAMATYEDAANLDGSWQLTAQLRQVQLLPHLQREAEIVPQVQTLVDQLPQDTLSLTQIYVALDLAQWLSQQSPEVLASTSQQSQSLLMRARAGADRGDDRKAQSYANGYLGHWHEQQQHWSRAQRFTQTALDLAQDLNATELTYQWQWQQGRIARAQGQNHQAIADYTAAVETLQTLRQDLVAITRDVQFSFRDQIEPIYRDLVTLLLSSEAPAPPSPTTLEQARQVIENLQLAQLNNFFQEPCLEAIPQPLETLDPTAAVLYPIILPDRLAVILSIPGQPLSTYSTPLPQADIEAGIQQLLDSMRVTSFTQERLPIAQQLYQWLIAPAEPILQAHAIQTLVFVLDGPLRSVPMATLHNGDHYLATDYQIALSPGLQLLQVNQAPTTLPKSQALIGGLSQGRQGLNALAGVQQEIDYINQIMETQTLLNETFTNQSLADQTQQRSFNIVHLASHAHFGETNTETFITTWDGRLQIQQLRQLIKQQELRGVPPELLILSACDTAQGNKNTALGMAGVAVRSGAQATLATLWRVNDQATATFIQHFYDGLINQNLTKSAALHYAQQQLQQTRAFQHPYYWAPFVLVGDWM